MMVTNSLPMASQFNADGKNYYKNFLSGNVYSLYMTEAEFSDSPRVDWTAGDDAALERLLRDASPHASRGEPHIPEPTQPHKLTWLTSHIGQLGLARDCPFCNGF